MSEDIHDLDYYLADPFYYGVRQDFEHLGYPDAETVEFLRLFEGWVKLIEEGHPSKALTSIGTLNLPCGLTLLIVYHLRGKGRGFQIAGFSAEPVAPTGSLMYLDNEYAQLEKLCPPDFFPDEGVESTGGLARQLVWGHKIAEEAIGHMLKKAIAEGEKQAAFELQIRQSEREKIEANLNDAVQAAISAAGIKRNPEDSLSKSL